MAAQEEVPGQSLQEFIDELAREAGGRKVTLKIEGRKGEEDMFVVAGSNDEEEFNRRVMKQAIEAGILKAEAKPPFNETDAVWCYHCEQGDFWHCSFIGSNYNSTESCPEADIEQDGHGRWVPRKFWKSTPAPITPLKPKEDKFVVSPAGGMSGGSCSSDAGKVANLAAKNEKAVLPYGLRFRCPSCHHWFDGESKLAGHVTKACPAVEEDLSWVMPCECCKGDLDKMLISRAPQAEAVPEASDPTT